MSLALASEEMMELTTSWKEEGIQIGLQQGRQEGECAIVLRQLARRLGRLSAATQKRIEQLPVPQLEALSEALPDFKQPAELTRWLEQHAVPSAGKQRPRRKS